MLTVDDYGRIRRVSPSLEAKQLLSVSPGPSVEVGAVVEVAEASCGGLGPYLEIRGDHGWHR